MEKLSLNKIAIEIKKIKQIYNVKKSSNLVNFDLTKLSKLIKLFLAPSEIALF